LRQADLVPSTSETWAGAALTIQPSELTSSFRPNLLSPSRTHRHPMRRPPSAMLRPSEASERSKMMTASVAFPFQPHAPGVHVLRPSRHVDRFTASRTGHDRLRANAIRILRRTHTRFHGTASPPYVLSRQRRIARPQALPQRGLEPRVSLPHRLNSKN
jgi:hypothetical protein